MKIYQQKIPSLKNKEKQNNRKGEQNFKDL